MSAITQAFGHITIGQIVVFAAGLYGIFQLLKRLYVVLAQIWEERKHREKSEVTLNDLMTEVKATKEKVAIVMDFQRFTGAKDFKHLYFKAKKQYDEDGFVLFDTYEEMYQTYDAYKAVGGNGNKTSSMMNEIEELPKQSIYTKLNKERKEKQENENDKQHL